MEIKILGSGCKKCKELYETVQSVVKEEGTEAVLEKVEDIKDIVGYGVMLTPGLVIDGKVKVSGRVPKKDEIKKWIEEAKV